MENKNLTIVNGELFFDGRFVKKDICIENGRVTGITEPGMMDAGNAMCGTAKLQILDATGKYIIPGLVDVHTHGRIGLDFSRITEEGLENLMNSYAACGVTNVVATTMTNETSVMEESLRIIGGQISRQGLKNREGTAGSCVPCAKLLGIHMEGPFLGKEKKGAHDEKYLQEPSWERLEYWQELCGENVRLITVDPCLNGAEGFIKKCTENGVKVSLGHTACGYETAVAASKAGADHVTHTFNAMNPLHHREPGLIGAAMDTGMFMELICDGIHVHPAMVRMLFAAHQDKVVLVSDSIAAAGLPDGEYESGGLKVTLQNGKAVLGDGTIAGSSVSLFDCMVNAIKFGVPAEAAVNSATYLAAKSVGMEAEAGCIAVGRKAECLIVDKEWNLEKVV